MFVWIIQLLTLRITINHIYLGKDVYYGCFRCELESGCQFEPYLDFCLVFIKCQVEYLHKIRLQVHVTTSFPGCIMIDFDLS